MIIETESNSGHAKNTVSRLAGQYPTTARIRLVSYRPWRDIDPQPNEVVYRQSTGGRWGQAPETRIGAQVEESERARKAALDEKETDERLAPYRQIIDELHASHILYPVIHDGDVAINERLPDCLGTFTLRIGVSGSVRNDMIRMVERHIVTYPHDTPTDWPPAREYLA